MTCSNLVDKTLCPHYAQNQMIRLVLVLFLALINFACSYHFGAVKRNIPGAYDRVAVPVFKNSTPEVGVEVYFTKSMIEELERGHIASITDKDNAQVIIEGEVVNIQYAPGSANTFSNLPPDVVLNQDYRILLDARIQARRKSDQKIIWSGDFKGEKSYPAPVVTTPNLNTVNPLYNHSSRHQNIEIMARDLMSEAYSRMTENF